MAELVESLQIKTGEPRYAKKDTKLINYQKKSTLAVEE